MSRSGYSDCLDNWSLIRWRGAVSSAVRGARGQAFLREMREALDALPEKRLIADELVAPSGEVCAIGAVCVARGLDTEGVDLTDAEQVGNLVGIARAMAAEIEFINDGDFYYGRDITPERRWHIVSSWVDEHLARPPLDLGEVEGGVRLAGDPISPDEPHAR